jgi:small-conductance mechanosensitive channel
VDFLDTYVLNDSIETWLKALGLAVLAAALLRAIVPAIIRRATRLATATSTHVDDALLAAAASTKTFFYVVAGIYAGHALLTLPAAVDSVLRRVLATAVLVQIGIWVASAFRTYLSRARDTRYAGDREVATSFNLVSVVGVAVVWFFTFVFVLQAWGVNVTALLTGLGIGGIAVALAVNSILADLFASLSIIFDKPFLVGDFLIVGDHMGTVEVIGLRSTQIRSLSGEQIVFSNNDLLKSRIRNYGRMEERRAVFTFGVTYETDPDLVERIPGWVREIVEEQPATRFDRCHFKSLGEWALEFETVYYMTVPAYNDFMDVQERVNLSLMRRLAAEGVEFAYPTQLEYQADYDRRAGGAEVRR